MRYVPRGYDVLAYDSRAHGDSSGEACTYGYFEKGDLRKAIDSLGVTEVAVIGGSLGAAVGLQAAAEDTRIQKVVSIATFSDLRTVARERAPFFASEKNIRDALVLAEQQGHFVVDDVSPEKAAARLSIPVLVIHGAADRDTPPAHSQRVYAALKGPKRLLLLPGAGHASPLGEDTWKIADEWLAKEIVRPERRSEAMSVASSRSVTMTATDVKAEGKRQKAKVWNDASPGHPFIHFFEVRSSKFEVRSSKSDLESNK